MQRSVDVDGKARVQSDLDGSSEAPKASYSGISDGCHFEVSGQSLECLGGRLISEDQATLPEAVARSGTPLGKRSLSSTGNAMRPSKPWALLFRVQSALLSRAWRHRKRVNVSTEPPTSPCSSCAAVSLLGVPSGGTPPRLQPNGLPDSMASYVTFAAEMDRWAWAPGKEVWKDLEKD
mmetsp:Transcript_22791/g.64576  ORF Transcript_22791/g.64576 Transcript_22791/m.64576 type:complete len:178 (-) Transcript_22791:78-611(-)